MILRFRKLTTQIVVKQALHMTETYRMERFMGLDIQRNSVEGRRLELVVED